MEKTVALYLRVSTKHQDTPEGSLISQEQRLIEWYDYHNSQAKHSKEKDPYSKYVIYKDVETGTKASKRPSRFNSPHFIGGCFHPSCFLIFGWFNATKWFAK